MLDVHPPEHAAHSWRDFFVHIATIVVGLLIAVGLEQGVEWLHNRHEILETREALSEERVSNRENFHKNVDAFLITQAVLNNDLRVFKALQEHPGIGQNSLPGVAFWYVGKQDTVISAWTAAAHTAVLALMPRDEVRLNTEMYGLLQQADDVYIRMLLPVLSSCSAYVSRDNGDVSRLSPVEIGEEIHCTSELLRLNELWGIQLRLISDVQKDFAPGPTDEEIWKYDSPSRLAELKERLPDAYAVTKYDLDANAPKGNPLFP